MITLPLVGRVDAKRRGWGSRKRYPHPASHSFAVLRMLADPPHKGEGKLRLSYSPATKNAHFPCGVMPAR